MIAAVPLTAIAQDSHYNSHSYGDRSTLLGGAVIASVDDASAAYYNPAALADVAKKDVFLGTKEFDFTVVTLNDIGLIDHDISSDAIGKAPSFVGGMIPLGSKEHRFAYSIFKRSSLSTRLTSTEVDFATLIGPLDVASNRLVADFDASLNDDWVGLSWAYPVSETTSIGASLFGSYRSHRYRSVRSAEFFREDATTSTTVASREYKYTYSSLLLKFGAKHQFSDRLIAGLSLTTPSMAVGLFSIGRSGVSGSVAGSRDPVSDFFVADFQRGLDVTYKTPFSIGLGTAYSYPDRTVHLSLEWFAPVDRYVVLEPEPFVGQSTGDTLQTLVYGGTRSVFNVSVGLEEHLSERVDGFFGFHTDFSSAREEPNSVYFTRWNLYHFNAGAQFLFGVAQITLGLGYAFGSEQTNEYITIGDLIRPGEPEFPNDDRTVDFQRLKFIVGFGVRT